MQLMPATASFIANKMQLPFSADRLTADGIYNVLLGRAYVETLIDDFGGSYALAIASYNAGPGRVRQWVRDYGDPRGGSIDMVDWIEMIPINETRNYVQRVLENLQIYRGQVGRRVGFLAGQRPRPLNPRPVGARALLELAPSLIKLRRSGSPRRDAMAERAPFLSAAYGAYHHRERPADDEELTRVGRARPAASICGASGSRSSCQRNCATCRGGCASWARISSPSATAAARWAFSNCIARIAALRSNSA